MSPRNLKAVEDAAAVRKEIANLLCSVPLAQLRPKEVAHLLNRPVRTVSRHMRHIRTAALSDAGRARPSIQAFPSATLDAGNSATNTAEAMTK